MAGILMQWGITARNAEYIVRAVDLDGARYIEILRLTQDNSLETVARVKV